MAINVSQAFKRTSANPIDESLALTKAQMKAVNDNLMPVKWFTIGQEDGKIYLYDKSNTVDETTGKFRVFEGGGGGASAMSDLTDVLLTSLQNGQTLSWNGSKWVNTDMPTVPTKVSQLTNDSGFISSETDPTVPSWAKQNTKPSYTKSEVGLGNVDNTSDADKPVSTAQQTALDAKQAKLQFETLPTASADYAGKIVEYVGATGNGLTHGYFYECKESDGTYSWVQTNVQPSSGGGDSTLTADVTANLTVGAILSGTTLSQGTTFTEFAQKLLITEIAPTTTFSASGSGVKEVGTSVTPTLTLNITDKGTGTPTAIKFYNGSTLLDTKTYVDGTNTYTYTMGAILSTTTVKGVLEYKKSDNTTASVEKTATYTFVMASYYGAVATAPTDKAGIVALTKNVKTGKGQTATFTLNNQRSCYAYPASFGNLTSIKDSNNFEYINSYTKTTVSVDGTNYNVYTLTDPVTATGFKQVYA